MWKWMVLFLRKNHLLRCWDWLSVPNRIGALTLFLLLKLPPRKLEPWFVLWSFFLLRLLCISIKLPTTTIRPCMEYCWNVWAGVPSRYLTLLDKLQKWLCRNAGASLAASLEPFAHRLNVASLSLFRTYYLGRSSSELAQLVPFPYSRGRSTRYSDRLQDFSVTILRCYKDVNSLFPRTARVWNSLPIECFPLTYDLNGFSSKINRHLLTVGSL